MYFFENFSLILFRMYVLDTGKLLLAQTLGADLVSIQKFVLSSPRGLQRVSWITTTKERRFVTTAYSHVLERNVCCYVINLELFNSLYCSIVT